MLSPDEYENRYWKRPRRPSAPRKTTSTETGQAQPRRFRVQLRGRSDWSFVSRARQRYADPTNRYLAGFASPWRRAAAAAIDWGLCYVGFLLVSIPLGTVQALGAISREEGDLAGHPGHVLVVAMQVLTVAPAIAYFALLLPTSQTFGMRMREIRTVSMRTGRGASYTAAIIRGTTATVMAAAFYAVFMFSTSFEKPRHLDSASTYTLDAAYVLVGAGCISALLMIVTPTHRSVLDRLFGAAVLDELEAVAPRMGPWGTLDVFDTSNRRVSARNSLE